MSEVRQVVINYVMQRSGRGLNHIRLARRGDRVETLVFNFNQWRYFGVEDEVYKEALRAEKREEIKR